MQLYIWSHNVCFSEHGTLATLLTRRRPCQSLSINRCRQRRTSIQSDSQPDNSCTVLPGIGGKYKKSDSSSSFSSDAFTGTPTTRVVSGEVAAAARTRTRTISSKQNNVLFQTKTLIRGWRFSQTKCEKVRRAARRAIGTGVTRAEQVLFSHTLLSLSKLLQTYLATRQQSSR